MLCPKGLVGSIPTPGTTTLMETYISVTSKLPVWALIGLAGVSVVSGDYLAKLWSVNKNGWLLLLALVAYSCSGVFYIPTLLRQGLVVTSIVWSIGSMVGFLAIGLVVFKESLSMAETVGVAFGVISLVILAFAVELK